MELARTGAADEVWSTRFAGGALIRPTTPRLVEDRLTALAEKIAAKAARAVVPAVAVIFVERAPEQERHRASDHQRMARDFLGDS
jgi:hypothetical protein